MSYKVKNNFNINCGFDVNMNHIENAIQKTNSLLAELPSTLYQSIDFKTTSAIIGAIFCDNLASITGSIVNPIEKGHPDIIPRTAENCSEQELKKYPLGLEIKCTVGNITTGVKLLAGEPRINNLTGVTWQAHHREVESLLGLVWDFVNLNENFNSPMIAGAFYSANLTEDDWGKISGTTGRNTKVTGMTASGKEKMGQGWLAIVNKEIYISSYQQKLKFSIPN